MEKASQHLRTFPRRVPDAWEADLNGPADHIFVKRQIMPTTHAFQYIKGPATDVVTAKSFAADAPAAIKVAQDVAADDMILDIGPETAAKLAAQLKAAGTIVWNGPVGVFEFDQFANGTKTIAQAIAESSAFSIAGGGDTLAAIAKYGIEKDVGYISTGGGAFLEVLEGKTLPAFEILAKRAAG